MANINQARKNSLISYLHFFRNFSLLAVFALVITTSTALAEYKVPSQPSPPVTSKTTTTTTRTGNCSNNNTKSLKALAPYSHVGKTVSTHPTFAWYVPESKSFPLEFSLYRNNNNGDRQKIYHTNLQSSPGMMKLTLPKDNPGLTTGQIYSWQVVLICNPNETTEAQVISAEIQVEAMSSQLKTQLAIAKETFKKADLFAEAGFWYDALATASQGQNNSLVDCLLGQLAKLEQLQQQASKLEQIAIDSQ
jgi:hypothetical protein